jgi:peroxiredoxin
MKSAAVTVGMHAPDFALPATDGRERRLKDERGRKAVVLFYRGHWCGACRAQMEDLRRTYLLFEDAGAAVLPISSEPLALARESIARDRLPFVVLSDEGLAVIDAWGVRHHDEPEGRAIARPAVFVLDRDGVVRFAHVGEAPRDRPPADLVLLALETIP